MPGATEQPEEYTSCRYGASEESIQPPGDDESHNDSVYFNFAAPFGADILGGVIRVGLRPNEGYGEASVVMPRPDGSVVFRYKRTELERDDVVAGSRSWRCDALELSAVEPTREWRLGYSSDAPRSITSPRDFAGDPGGVWRASEPVRCELDLAFRAEFPMHTLSPTGNLIPGTQEVAYGKNHYEQFGRIGGVVRLDDAEWAIDDVPAFRDHSWGPRVWESAPDQDFVTVYLEDGRRVAALANRIEGREDMHGVLLAPGDARPTQLERYEIRTSYAGGDAPEGAIGWTFEGGGRRIDVEGEVAGFLPLRVGRERVRIAQTLLRLDARAPGHAKTDLTRPMAGS